MSKKKKTKLAIALEKDDRIVIRSVVYAVVSKTAPGPSGMFVNVVDGVSPATPKEMKTFIMEADSELEVVG